MQLTKLTVYTFLGEKPVNTVFMPFFLKICTKTKKDMFRNKSFGKGRKNVGHGREVG